MEQDHISHSLVKTLRKVPMFTGLTDDDLLHIVGLSANLHWPEKSMVFKTGAPGDALYIVLSGSVRIFADMDGSEVDVATIGPGDFFGELSLMKDAPHSRSAEAVKETVLMVIPKQGFASLLSSDTGLKETVEKKMSERLALNDQALDLN